MAEKLKVAYYYNGGLENYYAYTFTKYLPSDVEIIHNECGKDVDFIYCGSPDAGGCLMDAVKAKSKYRKPLICFVWDIPYDLKGLRGVAVRNISILKICDKVISSSKYTQSTLRRLGVESSYLYFYCHDLDLIKDVPDEGKVQQIIQVGRYVPHKQHELLIDAFTQIKGTSLVCVGHGNHDDTYFKMLANRCGPNVKMLNSVPRDEVLKEIKKSKLLISSSHYEGFGLPPIEALFLDTPIMLMDMPVFKEIYGDKVPYFKDGDDLLEQLKDFISHEDTDGYIDTMLAVAKPQVATFTPELFAKRWIDECTKLLRNIK